MAIAGYDLTELSHTFVQTYFLGFVAFDILSGMKSCDSKTTPR